MVEVVRMKVLIAVAVKPLRKHFFLDAVYSEFRMNKNALLSVYQGFLECLRAYVLAQGLTHDTSSSGAR